MLASRTGRLSLGLDDLLLLLLLGLVNHEVGALSLLLGHLFSHKGKKRIKMQINLNCFSNSNNIGCKKNQPTKGVPTHEKKSAIYLLSLHGGGILSSEA